jgi:ribosomal protein S18 acetylase RimI-like enzyme
MGHVEMIVKRLGNGDGLLYRDIRLRATRDSPVELNETMEEAQTRPNSYWNDFVNQSDRAAFLAWEDGACGTISVSLDKCGEQNYGSIFAMWVEATGRGRGIGRALLDAAIGWAYERGVVWLSLFVSEGNNQAIGFYQGGQFSIKSGPHPLPPNSQRFFRMERWLAEATD